MSPADITWRCSYGALHRMDEHCRCGGALLARPAATPTDLPGALPAGTTVRYHIDADLVPHLRAVLKHEAAPELEGAAL
jgi:hypothetical protein